MTRGVEGLHRLAELPSVDVGALDEAVAPRTGAELLLSGREALAARTPAILEGLSAPAHPGAMAMAALDVLAGRGEDVAQPEVRAALRAAGERLRCQREIDARRRSRMSS